MKLSTVVKGLLVSAFFCLPLALDFKPLSILKLKTFDYFVPQQEPSGYFTILNITEEDVQELGGYPFPRKVLGDQAKALMEAGALGVGYVISFIDPDRYGGDELFARQLEQIPSSVIATFEYDNQNYPEPTGVVILGNQAQGIPLKGHIPTIPELQKIQQGMVSAPLSDDGLVRMLPLLFQTPDGWIPTFGTQVLKSLAGTDTFIIKTNETGIEEITVKGIPPSKVDRYGRKWLSWVDTPVTTLDNLDVANKFVFVGVTAKGVMPQLATSKGDLMYPHYIQAALAESMLIETNPYVPYWHLSAELGILAISVLLIWLLTQSFGVTYGLAGGILVLFGTAYGGFSMIQRGILVDVSWALVSQFIAASLSFYLNFRTQYKLRLQIKKQFEHYLDPRQVKRLQENPESLKLGGEKKYCTYLFTDVRGFTPLTEKLEPEEVTNIMNRVLTVQADAVKKNGGMVDKYIGDAMMAVFGAPLMISEPEDKAIDTMIDILDGVKLLNYQLENEGLPTIKIGVGINSGESIVGNMGSSTRFDYTCIGDAVNVAARLESNTKELEVSNLIGEATAKNSTYKLQELDGIMVKGKSQKLNVYTWRFDL
tara:strand:- start:1223 stop:3010 length:1788 start_codon:yes stop_codon:yes gene_type:complete